MAPPVAGRFQLRAFCFHLRARVAPRRHLGLWREVLGVRCPTCPTVNGSALLEAKILALQPIGSHPHADRLRSA